MNRHVVSLALHSVLFAKELLSLVYSDSMNSIVYPIDSAPIEMLGSVLQTKAFIKLNSH
jgi:hypothetical protein